MATICYKILLKEDKKVKTLNAVGKHTQLAEVANIFVGKAVKTGQKFC